MARVIGKHIAGVGEPILSPLSHKTATSYYKGIEGLKSCTPAAGNFATFAAILCASSFVSSLAAEPPAGLILEIDIGKLYWPGPSTFSTARISGSSKLSTFVQKRSISFMFFSKA
jgi:hypothetical protein